MFNFFKKNPIPKPLGITQESFGGLVEQTPVMVLMFTADWCGACKMWKPIFTDITKKNLNQEIVFGIVDVEKERGLQAEFNVRSLPTLVVIKNKEIVHHGQMMPKMRFQEYLDTLLA